MIDFCITSKCEYYYGDLDTCMLGEEGVPSNLEQKCIAKTKKLKGKRDPDVIASVMIDSNDGSNIYKVFDYERSVMLYKGKNKAKAIEMAGYDFIGENKKERECI